MSDRDDLALMRKLLGDATVVLTVQTEQGVYPYEMTDGEQLKLDNFSMSTNSMVCHAIASLGGLLPDSRLSNCRDPDRYRLMTERLKSCMRNGLAVAIDTIASTQHLAAVNGSRSSGQSVPAMRRSRVKGPFDSLTFGREDPFTLTWLFELLKLVPREPDLAINGNAQKALDLVVKTAAARVRKTLQQPRRPVLEPIERKERAVPHPLPLLRIVHLAKLLGSADDDELIRKLADIFFDRLHLQLSFRNIEHGGFDVAELVFCFEGLLETAHLRATSSIVSSFHDAIEASRQLDPAFRAVTPFKATSAGAVHLFSGVEVASSLLRCVSLRVKTGDHAFFERIKPALRDYLQWLQATVLTGRAELPPASDDDSYPHDVPLDYFGWQSEHSHTGDRTVHIWLTSQVILFLRSYESLLARDIARQALFAVGLQSMTEHWEPEDAESRRRRAAEEDPLQLSAESPYRVVTRLDELLVAPRLETPAAEGLYSCLLYGPPGTGKTTLARKVAQDLGWPLLTITTSDFIIDGEAQVEARAKKLFEALDAQSEIVVFFDEIDRLVLDRDTPDYSQQGDMLQFMTPSMLTKINSLRRAESTIFLIGTNYADRIDRAIKRAGRIDQRLLVLPPDLARRIQIIHNALAKHALADVVTKDDIQDAALCGHWLTIAELKSAVREFSRVEGRLIDHVSRLVPAVSLSSYLRRLERLNDLGHGAPPAELLEEAFLLVYLLMEGKDKVLPEEYDPLINYWSTRAAGIVRDEDVTRKLELIFDRAK